MRRAIYMDNHATTRCDPDVLQRMWPFFDEAYGNASSRAHRYGSEARDATEIARAHVATWLGASPKEVIFTSGATEANNLAILGAARARRANEGKDHVVTVATEHSAVLDPVARLAREGFATTVLPVDAEGRLDPEQVAGALRPSTALVSVMLVNNEIGVVHPVSAIGEVCRARGVWLHCDAAQAGYVPVDLRAVDLLSVSAHKIYGPKGIGALYVRRSRPRIELEPVLFGGGHERGLRSGTLPVPLCVGLGAAAEKLVAARPEEVPRVRALRDRLLAGLQARVDGLWINGSVADRSPNNLNLAFDEVEAAALLMAVRDTVALSTGSACSAETLAPSHVLAAIGARDRAPSSVRFGLGRFNTEVEVDEVVEALASAVSRLRALGSAESRAGGAGTP